MPGDSDFNSVSLEVIHARTIEELDKKDGKVVKIDRWAIDPDGSTHPRPLRRHQGQGAGMNRA